MLSLLTPWPRTRVLVLEPGENESLRATLIGAADDRELKVVKRWEDFPHLRLLEWIKRTRLAPHIVLTAPKELVCTLTVPVTLEREAPRAPLGNRELETILGKLHTKLFSTYRKEASERLITDELDTILVESSVQRVSVDGHPVLHPIGLPGRRLELVIRLTFTTREIFSEWHEFFTLATSFLFTDPVRAKLFSLSRLGEERTKFFSIGEKESALFELRPKERHLERIPISWGSGHVTDRLSEAWGVSREQAHALYKLFIEGRMSRRMQRTCAALLAPAFETLQAELSRHLKRSSIYSENDVLPLRASALIPFSEARAHEHFGFSIAPELLENDTLTTALASFLECYDAGAASTMNQWLRQRLHWLAPVL